VLLERIPATGLIILRDGEPGKPEVTLSSLTYFFEHRAEQEVVIQIAGLFARRTLCAGRRGVGLGFCIGRRS